MTKKGALNIYSQGKYLVYLLFIYISSGKVCFEKAILLYKGFTCMFYFTKPRRIEKRPIDMPDDWNFSCLCKKITADQKTMISLFTFLKRLCTLLVLNNEIVHKIWLKLQRAQTTKSSLFAPAH